MTETHSKSTSYSAFTTFAAQVAIAVLSLANVIVIGRILGPSGRGSVAFLTTIGFISSWLSTFGVDQAISNVAARLPDARRALAGNAVMLAFLFGGLAAAIVLAGTLVFPAVQGDASRGLLILVMLNVPLLVLQIYLRQLAAAQYRFGIGNLTAVVPAVINIVGNLGLYLAGHLSVTSAIVTWLLGQAVGTLWLAWYVHARLEGFGRPSLPLVRQSLRFGIRAHTSHTMNLGNYRADQWIMGILSTPQQLGLYSVAVSWSEALFLLPQALMQVQRPDLARSEHHHAGPRAALAFRLSILLTFVLCALMIAAAPILCVTVFGEDFRGSIVDLRIVALGGFGIVALKLLGSALTAQERPLRESLAVGVTFVTVLALDFILIPSLGGEGASIASAVGYTAGGLAMAWIFCWTMKLRLRSLLPGWGTVLETLALAKGLRADLAAALVRRPAGEG
ncbi:MAG TPA: oligosaccharide flippase family protein [Solirubrobacterales bacterium]|jgi:O-antigen/teichoic acid export membrane protein|nr:oligosaccharide flippase family protein [Solirubrobacterales bacterium]